ncbi:hypothetical protein [Nocardia donostiensis]|uniref:Uncharacterized protein n=1 Tax=Nocardia donostiensis TaxID=1538463 RepID=A0A1W0ASW1_9NOCA|nr:hypothetical protein [Nocardia donostiensis]ONM46249.1 hypothetical protein B0T46_24000 [Nocardia donostiensis]OQS13326.1 hypothetical protein B0T36_19595 [Nocardia donostiensis]OQS18426.1 hypothetical protein B0T44_19690 [Nocardia donostiensis]
MADTLVSSDRLATDRTYGSGNTTRQRERVGHCDNWWRHRASLADLPVSIDDTKAARIRRISYAVSTDTPSPTGTRHSQRKLEWCPDQPPLVHTIRTPWPTKARPRQNDEIGTHSKR